MVLVLAELTLASKEMLNVSYNEVKIKECPLGGITIRKLCRISLEKGQSSECGYGV